MGVYVKLKALVLSLLVTEVRKAQSITCKNSTKYYIKNSTIEIQNIILTNNPNLSEDSILCQKCYLRLKRGQNLIDSSKPKKCQKLDRTKCIINSCK